MKHKAAIGAGMLLLFALVLLGAALLGSGQARQGNDVRLGAGDETVVLYPLESENGVYRITIDRPADGVKRTLVLAAMRPFTLLENGKQVYAYEKSDRYRRMHLIDLPEDGTHVELEIRSPGSQQHLKALVTTHGSATQSVYNAQMASVLLLGMQIAILFVCGMLYAQKRSESYLLAECLAVMVTLISALLTSGVFSLPISEGGYVYIQYLMDSVRMPILQAVSVLLIPVGEQRFFKFYRKHVLALTAFFSVLLLSMHVAQLRAQASVVSQFVWLATAVLCVEGLERKEPCMKLFTLGYVLRFALNVYTSLTNTGVLTNTRLLVYFYVPQMNNLLFILPCMYIVNHRFAGKYTQAEELAEALGQSNRLLDAKVEQRTKELIEQQNKRRNMMVNIFHDLRSPIFSARGCADMLHTANEQEAELLDIIKTKLDFLGQLTEKLFLAAKLEDNQVTFVSEPVDLRALCAHIVREYRESFEGKTFAAELGEEASLYVAGDGFHLRQVLENLLTNAAAFTPEGGRVTLALQKCGDQAKITLSDTGVGIEKEDLPYVFERYYQGRNSDKQRSSGLGLFIAADIVKKHRGTIEVQSEPGKGTTFEIRLPLLELGSDD